MITSGWSECQDISYHPHLRKFVTYIAIIRLMVLSLVSHSEDFKNFMTRLELWKATHVSRRMHCRQTEEA